MLTLSLSVLFSGDASAQDKYKGGFPVLDVKVLSIPRCPATSPTIKLVEEVASEMDVKISLSQVVISSQDEADRNRFVGSPTVQINGKDLEPKARSINSFGVI
jgi:hypothetical protein